VCSSQGTLSPGTMRAAREALRATAHTVSRGAATSAGAPGVAGGVPVRIHNPSGVHRVVVTKDLPGTRWLDILTAANCRVEVRAPRRIDSPSVGDTQSRGFCLSQATHCSHDFSPAVATRRARRSATRCAPPRRLS